MTVMKYIETAGRVYIILYFFIGTLLQIVTIELLLKTIEIVSPYLRKSSSNSLNILSVNVDVE